MSLKAFHLTFIVISIVFLLGFTVWCLAVYASDEAVLGRVFGYGALVGSAALIAAERRVLRTLRGEPK